MGETFADALRRRHEELMLAGRAPAAPSEAAEPVEAAEAAPYDQARES